MKILKTPFSLPHSSIKKEKSHKLFRLNNLNVLRILCQMSIISHDTSGIFLYIFITLIVFSHIRQFQLIFINFLFQNLWHLLFLFYFHTLIRYIQTKVWLFYFFKFCIYYLLTWISIVFILTTVENLLIPLYDEISKETDLERKGNPLLTVELF